MANAKSNDARLERLEGLARLWAVLYFLHPKFRGYNAAWERALVEAIRPVEKARTPETYARSLNESLLRQLDDRFTFADSGTRRRAYVDSADAVSSRVLQSGTGYIDLRATKAFERPSFLNEVSEALKQLRGAKDLILDMRLDGELSEEIDASLVFGFFLREPVRQGGKLQRVRYGWHEEGESGAYRENWEHTDGHLLRPIQHSSLAVFLYPRTVRSLLTTYGGSLCVIVNDYSFARLAGSLAGLQDAGRALALHETAGGVRSTTAMDLWGGVKVQMRLALVVRRDGSTEFRPDERIETTAKRPRDALHVADGLFRRRTSGPRPAVPARSPALTTDETADPSIRSTRRREERLLGLFKLWACVHYFFPHVTLADIQWSRLIRDWVPKIEAARSARAYYDLLLRLTARLNDSHVRLNHPAVDEILGTHTPPLWLKYVEGSVVVIGVDDGRSGLDSIAIGSVVTHVDGKAVARVMQMKKPLLSASTPQALAQRLVDRGTILAGARNSSLSLRLQKGKESKTLRLARTMPQEQWYKVDGDGPAWRRLQDGLGYIDLRRVPSAPVFREALQSLVRSRGLILDMRGSPKFWVQRDVVRHLVDEPYASGQYLVPVLDGELTVEGDSSKRRWEVIQYHFEPDKKLNYRRPVVVLIDSTTMSAAEDFCIHLRNCGRGVFVGAATTGTDGDIALLRLPGGASLSFTGMRVTYADGTRFQNHGIAPDILVVPTIRATRPDRDEILEAGIAHLKRVTSAETRHKSRLSGRQRASRKRRHKPSQ